MKTGSKPLRLLLGSAIFFSAFLLFLVQPMVARVILPRFGGAASVWTVCMLFFQTVLLGGYFAAHLVATRRKFLVQVALFTILALGAALALSPNRLMQDSSALGSTPEMQILVLLLITIGGPYALLSCVSPLLQSWMSRLEDSQSFYRLYALSNFGSLLALLAYPLVVERNFGARAQLLIWSSGFLADLAILLTCAGLIGMHQKHQSAAQTIQLERSSLKELSTWWVLSFLGSVALISFTNFLTSDVAPVPLLWVVPLALYLLSFIVVFERDRPINRDALFLLTYGLILGVADKMITGLHAQMIVSGSYILITLFCCCLVCHGELARLKPARSRLTSFYLTLSFGGCSGGIFVGLIAPRIFSAYWEFPLVLLGVLFVLAWNGRQLIERSFVALRGRRSAFLSAALFLFATIVISRSLFIDQKHPIASARNFYGVLRIVDVSSEDSDIARRTMFHGRVNHGTQLKTPGRELTPTAYFAEGSGAWLAMNYFKADEQRRIGIIGLGAGVIAANGKKSDSIEYYEINPLVEKFAREYFTFLSGSAATTSVQIGDGRLLLEKSAAKNLDLLILDAFSGDAIPSHLLTREAFQEYLRHLKPDGLLVLHISNQHLNLEPVVWSIVESLGLRGAFFYQSETPKPYLSRSYYMMVSRDGAFFSEPEIASKITRTEPKGQLAHTWTDDWIDLFGVIRWGGDESK